MKVKLVAKTYVITNRYLLHVLVKDWAADKILIVCNREITISKIFITIIKCSPENNKFTGCNYVAYCKQ